MFYSTQILAKKGPLGTVWIAAHLERRLKRHQVFETSISVSVDSIINPDAPLALRLSGQLLLGVVRVYSRKVGYLFQDCNEALVKIKSAFAQAGIVDLPDDAATATLTAITLPDNYDSIEILVDPSPAIILTLDEGEGGLGEDLAFTVRDGSISLDADYNALTYDAAPAQDEVFEDTLELDLDNVEYMPAVDEEDEEAEDPEVLRAAETPVAPGGDAGDLGLGLEATTQEKEAAAARGAEDDDDYYDAGDDWAGDMPPEDAPYEEMPMGAETPAEGQGEEAGLGGLSPGGVPSLPGMTPNNELAAIGDTPDGAPNEEDDDAAPQLGINGAVIDEPWGSGDAGRSMGAVRQRAKKPKEAAVVDDGEDGRPSKEMAGTAIRALLQDRSPILVNRGFRAGVNTRIEKKLDKKRKLAQTQMMMRRPAIPCNTGSALGRLWEAATASSTEARTEAQRAAKAAAKAKRVKKAVEARQPEEEEEEEEEEEQGRPEVEVEEEDQMPPPPEDYGEDDFGGGAYGDEEEEVEDPDAADEGEDGSAAKRQRMEEAEVDFVEDGEVEVVDPADEDKEQEEEEEEDGMPRAVELLQSGDQEQDEAGTCEAQATTFTANTKAVLKHLRSVQQRKKAKEAETGQKGKEGLAGLNSLLAGKKRLDASRWFFELLVLKSKDYVDLEQKDPFGDIKIKASSKLRGTSMS